MEVRELSRDEKLKVIDEILSEWKRQGCESFICKDVLGFAVLNGFIDTLVYKDIIFNITWFAVKLIPELQKFKPDELPDVGWFGEIRKYGGRRTYILQCIRKMISEKEPLKI